MPRASQLTFLFATAALAAAQPAWPQSSFLPLSSSVPPPINGKSKTAQVAWANFHAKSTAAKGLAISLPSRKDLKGNEIGVSAWQSSTRAVKGSQIADLESTLPNFVQYALASRDSSFMLQEGFAQVVPKSSSLNLSSRVFLWGLPAAMIVPAGAVGMQVHPALLVPAYDESYGVSLALHRTPSSDGSRGGPFWHGITHAWSACRTLFRR